LHILITKKPASQELVKSCFFFFLVDIMLYNNHKTPLV